MQRAEAEHQVDGVQADDSAIGEQARENVERDAIVQSRGYRGTFVRPDAKAHCDVDLKALAIEKLDATISALRAAGVTPSEIRIAFGTLMNGKSE